MTKKEDNFFARNRFWIAICTLIGTIVGAGILGIPYVVAKSGFLVGLVIIVVIGLAFLLLNLFAGEIVLRTKKQYQLTGYAGKYLGKWGKRLMTVSMLVGIYGALIAYLIGEGEALFAIFGFGSPLIYTLIFFVVASFITYRGIKTAGAAELIIISLLFLVVILIGVLSFGQINYSNLTTYDFSNLLFPYGVILFAFIGTAAIPELQEELVSEKKKMKKAIILGSVIPIILYVLFAMIIIGIIGLNNFEVLAPNQRIATVALSIYTNPLLGLFANLLAVLAMFSSFLTLGIALAEIYEYDYKFSKRKSFFLMLSLPLLVALFKLTTFITVLGITGALAGGLDGILVVLSYWRCKKLGDRKPEYSLGKHWVLGSLLILMFVSGIIYVTITTII